MANGQGNQYGWQDGNASEPTVCFQNDPRVGLYLAAPGVLGIASPSGAVVMPGSVSVAAPLTGATVTMAAGQRSQIINPAGTIAALTLVLPPSPIDGQIAYFSSTHIITALTLSAPGGASVAGAVTAMAVGDSRAYIFNQADNAWYPY